MELDRGQWKQEVNQTPTSHGGQDEEGNDSIVEATGALGYAGHDGERIQ